MQSPEQTQMVDQMCFKAISTHCIFVLFLIHGEK